MNKQNQKDLKKQYKAENRQKSLNKLLEIECSWIQDYANLELGNTLPAITKEEIAAADNGAMLTERLYFKILELARKNSPNNNSIFDPRTEHAIHQLSDYLQVIYFTYLFESALAIGDIDKQFIYLNALERLQQQESHEKLKRAYTLMDCDQMVSFILTAEITPDCSGLQEVAKKFDEKAVENKRLQFIKAHWQEFILK